MRVNFFWKGKVRVMKRCRARLWPRAGIFGTYALEVQWFKQGRILK